MTPKTPEIPATMTAIEILEPGGPEMLAPATRPVDMPGKGEVLVKVAAAGVNRPDVMQRQGVYPAPKGVTDIPGLEVSGTIATIGGDGTDWKPGDAVCALVSGGGYAEYCLAPAAQCLPVPKGLDMIQAAALPETFFAVWANIVDRTHLHKGKPCSSMAAQAALAPLLSRSAACSAPGSSSPPEPPKNAPLARNSAQRKPSITAKRTSWTCSRKPPAARALM